MKGIIHINTTKRKDNMKTTEAQKRATAKYQEANTRLFSLRLNYNTDQDIIDRLNQVESKAGYIKELIREDIKRGH